MSVLGWNAHCHRANDADMWHCYLLKFRPASWIEDQRTKFGIGFIKRTKTRLAPGHVCRRWEESLDQALDLAPHWTAVLNSDRIDIQTLLSALIADH